jgi:hypothetical protein
MQWGLAVIGIGIMAGVLIPALQAFKPYPGARLMVTNLLRTNPRQAEMMCRTAEGTFLEGIGAALKTAQMVGSRDLKMIQQATLPSYDAQGTVAMQKWKGYLMKAKLGAMAAGGSVVLGFQKEGIPWITILIAVGVCAGYGLLFLKTNEVERSIILGRREVLPEVDRVFVDGRY